MTEKQLSNFTIFSFQLWVDKSHNHRLGTAAC